ncbi:carbohydrate porin [Labrys wisconsinensis]|uniref:Porin n=1 Tax=Labrys wisconsinensis TaxID=425677 RepID=A0ABU0JI42_9HYPH|nr:carbohydrate porin [Labrys wisconsinensis]MDQ0473952.1 porin [Labrys wisconsinensis]
MTFRDLAGRYRDGTTGGLPGHAFDRHEDAHRLRRRAGLPTGLVLGALVLGAWPAKATEPSQPSPSLEGPGAADATVKKPAHAKKRVHPSKPAESAAAPPPLDSAARARALDEVYGYKGWNIPFPSYGDSLTQDDGNWRSVLASYGFGFTAQFIPIAQGNILDTPRRVPSSAPPCQPSNIDYNCAGGRSYFGQRPDIYDSNLAYLTYDTSRWGIPDGQIAAGAHWGLTTDQAYSPNTFRGFLLSWYQTLFDKRVEIKVGYFPSLTEFMGTFVGGIVTNPFGPGGFLPLVMGMSPNNIGTPNFRATWHITDAIYAQTGIQRSLPVNGPTGNPIYDEVDANPSGFDFGSPVRGTRVLYTNELGYRTQAAPERPGTWLRAGLLYNSSTFKDYSRLLANPAATKDGALGFYVLGDYQVWQQAPSSPLTAYRGLYLGATFMRGSAAIAAFNEYYEARAYWLGPFDSRPQDMVSLIYNHNVVSKYVQDLTNQYSQYTNLFANEYANSVTASYMFHVRPGLYTTIGLGYTDHPSIQYFKGEGSSLNLLFSMYITL